MTESAWLERRKQGIGASEVAAVLGYDPYCSPYELWARKTGRLERAASEFHMRLGHRLEPVIADLFTEETGVPLEDLGDYAIVECPEAAWLFCTPDRLVSGTQIPVELKSASSYASTDWHDESVPLHYQMQLQMQMLCLGADNGFIAALVGNQDFFVREMERNDKFTKILLLKTREFWQGIQDDTPPPLDNSVSTARAWRALHPKDNGEVAELPAEAMEIIEEYEACKRIIAATVKQKDELQFRLQTMIGDATYGVVGEHIYQYKHQPRKGYVVKDSESRVLRKIKEIKT